MEQQVTGIHDELHSTLQTSGNTTYKFASPSAFTLHNDCFLRGEKMHLDSVIMIQSLPSW